LKHTTVHGFLLETYYCAWIFTNILLCMKCNLYTNSMYAGFVTKINFCMVLGTRVTSAYTT